MILYKREVENTISIHPPRMGWDYIPFLSSAPIAVFQSTHPAWGGTRLGLTAKSHRYISIHPPRMGWDKMQRHERGLIPISIHPPRMGWDL